MRSRKGRGGRWRSLREAIRANKSLALSLAFFIFRIGAAKIVYQRSSKVYYLMVSIEVEIPELDPLNITRVSGVDVGMRYLAVETD